MTQKDPSDAGRPAGLLMLVVSFVMGMVLLTMFFDNWLGQQDNPNQQPITRIDADGAYELQLQRNRQGHYVFNGLINDTRAVFLMDTGATDVVLSEQLAVRAGLVPGVAMQAMTANGPVTVYSTTIRELRLGDIVLENVRASINPAMSGDGALFGMSALRHIEFSQVGDALTLRYVP
jgi:aspartyl protease family protein